MFGLGASDCKGGVAAIVYGAAIFREIICNGEVGAWSPRPTGLSLAEKTGGETPPLVRLDDFSLVIMGATLEEDAEGFALRSLVERDGCARRLCSWPRRPT